jgi:3-oxoacyl-[acyl-carrier protein] reductase
MSRTRTAIVTGAARGIGKAIAARLVCDGYQVVVADIDDAMGRENAQQLAADEPDSAFALSVDVSDPSSVAMLVSGVLTQTGRIDVLVNNAGIAGLSANVVDYPISEWRRIMAINLDGSFYCCQAVLPGMLERGSGRIVNIASIAGKEGNPRMPAYSSSKAGVIAFTKSLAKEVAKRGIFVNCIAPAAIETDIAEQIGPEVVALNVSKIPMGRMGQPSEVAALVSWLASDECSFSTGAVYDLSGGRATY